MNYIDSLASKVQTPHEAIKIIADNMLKIRPRVEVTYHPYKKNDIYSDRFCMMREIDLKKLYPEGNPEWRMQLRRGYLYVYCNKHGLIRKRI